MHSSENAVDIVARCGGYFKASIIKNLTVPKSFFRYLSRKNELNLLFYRARCQGELIYFLPPKYVTPWWNYKPREVNEYGIFRSFALILYFVETVNLPYTRQDLKKAFPKETRRIFNGVYWTVDENTDEQILIVVDYYKTEKKLLSIIDAYRNEFTPAKSPIFHIVTFRPKFPIIDRLQGKRPTERIEIFSYPELKKLV